MESYIIWDVTCKKQLTKQLFWYERNSDLEGYGYVFTNEGVSYIKEIGVRWNIQPAYKQKATWNESDGTKIVGNLEPILDD